MVSLHCKDKSKGFGFQIENYEESSGTYKVVVSNLTRGGVADTSGQLKVGDWILSVNGISTLGYAVEKVYNYGCMWITHFAVLLSVFFCLAG